MRGGNEISLIGTGVTLGIVHILTGPDHLSALATLSVNVGDVQEAFFLGIRWGLGHSTGLLLVGIILIALDACNGGKEMIGVPGQVSLVFDTLLGICMLLLGVYGIRRAWQKRSKTNSCSEYARILPASCHDHYGGVSVTTVSHSSTSTTINQEEEQLLGEAAAEMDIESYQNQHTKTQPLVLSGQKHDGVEDLSPPPAQEIAIYAHSHWHPHIHHHGPVPDDDGDEEEADMDNDESLSSSTCSWSRQYARRCRRISARTMAVFAGIIHGLAGPGGVLGVIPAVQLHNGKLATIYLASFCLSSTLTMGVFAIVYGTCSSRLGGGGGGSRRRLQQEDQHQRQDESSPPVVAITKSTQCEFLIEIISAFLSILMGTAWLTLLSLGKLDEVFP